MVTLLADQDTHTSQSLRPLLRHGAQEAAARKRPLLVSLEEPALDLDPLRMFAAATGMARSFWEHQEGAQSLSFAAIDVAHRITASGRSRFQDVDHAWRSLCEGALISPGGSVWGSGPLLFGGFAFDPLHPRTAIWSEFPDAAMTLPRLMISRTATGTLLTLNCVLHPNSDPERESEVLLGLRGDLLSRLPHEVPEASADCNADRAVLEDVLPVGVWQRKVAATAADVRAARYAKVVLARQALLRLQGAPGTAAVHALHLLRRSYPGAFLFALGEPAGGAESLFVGASPERLLRLEGDVVQTTVLAGSAPRGNSVDEDRALGRALMNSAKDRHEHAVVATMMRWALAAHCRSLETPAAPSLMLLKNVQHLYTPVQGRLNGPHSALELADRLHPTPAVGGFPRGAALQAIRDNEDLDRGWYAAPVGWMDRAGQGEFAVALRSALLRAGDRGCEARLFAGCGIMGDSDPGREYEESAIKMQAMLKALVR